MALQHVQYVHAHLNMEYMYEYVWYEIDKMGVQYFLMGLFLIFGSALFMLDPLVVSPPNIVNYFKSFLLDGAMEI